jgi:hypothetical protein
MTEPGEISEDRGFKALVSSYPVETIEVFVPELLIERGRPISILALQQESSLPDLADPNRFLDVALLATWGDGSMAVILLVEHWSQARKVDLRRVNWYVADLALRHPLAAVCPVVLVTDPSAQVIPDKWDMTVAGVTRCSLQVRVYRVTTAELPRLRSLQNRVAAVLTTLAMQDAVEAVIAALDQMARSPGPYDDVKRFLPFTVKLAKMLESDKPRFRRRLEEADMRNVALMMEEEARAEGRAKGHAEGHAEGRAEGRAEAFAQSTRATVAVLSRLVAGGVLTREAARAELQNLMESGALPREIAQEALSQFT